MLAKRHAREQVKDDARRRLREEQKALESQTDEAIDALARRSSQTREERLSELMCAREQERKGREEAIRAMPPLPPLDDLAVDEVLVALVAYVVSQHETRIFPSEKFQTHPWSAERIADCVLYARGEEPPFSWGRNVQRDGLRETRTAVVKSLRSAREDGFVEYGLTFEDRHRNQGGYWFITRRGLSRVAKLTPRTAPTYPYVRGERPRHEVDLGRAVRLLRRHKRPLFLEEVEALMPSWMDERRAALRRGKRAYREWLREARATDQAAMLWFTDDEVEATVRRMGRPVRQVDVMAELAPADTPGDRLKGEVAHLSQQLVRLHREGRLVRRKRGSIITYETATSV